jgi:Protein of unknown function (DUF3168)
MSDAMIIFQAAAVAALAARPGLGELTGIYDGPPPRAAFPYVSISGGATSDWSTKTATGRELRFALTIWDDGEEALRLHMLMAEAEAAVASVPRDLPGWRVASLVFARSLIARDPAGPWVGLIEHRVRMLAA